MPLRTLVDRGAIVYIGRFVLAMIHSIMRANASGVTSPFTAKYIFPGGYIPALSETVAAVEQSRLWLQDCEIWRKHYATTIEEWAKRFAANRDRAKAMYDERFCRMWELYLALSESAFRNDRLMIFQIQQIGLLKFTFLLKSK